MIGQLDWEGVVHPIQDVTWENVVSTAERFQGLEFNEEFFVTYKDDEGDVINVKNEVDLAEAIRWAEEQGVPCLCLHVPFASAESDSDESWTEVDNGASPNLARQPVVSVDRQLVLNEEVPVTEDEVEHEVETSREEETGTVEPEQQEAGEEEAVAEESNVVEEPAAPQPFETVVTLEPIIEVFQESAPVVVDEPPKEQPRIDTDRMVELLYSVNAENAGNGSENGLFAEVLSDKNAVAELAALFATSAVQDAVAAVANSAKSANGVVLKSITTQLIKLLYKEPTLFDKLARIPHFEEVLVQALRKFKVNPVVAAVPAKVDCKPKTRHENVTCDGCATDRELERQSVDRGFRDSTGQILGARYKSSIVPDYDLCEACEACGNFQDQAGPFLKIVNPATAPEVILCALPGTTSGMMSSVDNLDWRNPVAREFLDFVKGRRQRAFPQQRQPSAPVMSPPKAMETVPEQVEAPVPVPVAVAKPVEPPAVVVPVSTPPKREFKCKHPLKTFETPHGGFTCDVCSWNPATRSVMHGCRSCNFDVCQGCQTVHNFQLHQAPIAPVVPVLATPAPVAVAAAAPPQAKFVSDVTLADGCVVRPGEQLDKTWRIRNSGSDRWPAGTRIAHVGGDAFGGPINGVEVPLAAPGEAVNVTVPLTMPNQPGRYTSYWRMMTPHPTNSKFGHRFWVTVNVIPAPAAPVFSAPPLHNAGTVIRPPPPQPFGQLPGSPALPGRPFPPPPTVRPVPPPPPVVREEPVVDSELETAVAQITEFGFTDIDKIVKILKEVNGDASAAIDKLLEEA